MVTSGIDWFADHHDITLVDADLIQDEIDR